MQTIMIVLLIIFLLGGLGPYRPGRIAGTGGMAPAAGLGSSASFCRSY